MRLVGAGTRDLPEARRLWWDFIREVEPQLGGPITRVASGVSEQRRVGGAVDLACMAWAKWRGLPYDAFPYPTVSELVECGVDVSTMRDPRRAAGPIRNRWMAEWAALEPGGVLVLVWDGRSPGSASMKREAQATGLRIFERVVT